MSSLLTAILAPEVLAVILTAFGSIMAWLVKQARANRTAHQACEIRLARAEEAHKADREEINRLTGSVEILTALLKKEIHLG